LFSSLHADHPNIQSEARIMVMDNCCIEHGWYDGYSSAPCVIIIINIVFIITFIITIIIGIIITITNIYQPLMLIMKLTHIDPHYCYHHHHYDCHLQHVYVMK